MKKNVLDTFLAKVIEKKKKTLSPDLFYGKSGMALYYSLYDDSKSRKLYNLFIKDVLTLESVRFPYSIENGILGVCLSIDYILDKNHSGNPEIILEYLDNIIYKEIHSDMRGIIKPLDQCVEILFYFAYHLKYGLKNKSRRDIFIKESEILTETTYSMFDSLALSEPMPFRMLSKRDLFLMSLTELYSQGIYKTRIEHILKEMSYMISIPKLHANRLVLLCLILKISSVLEELPYHWKDCANILMNNISTDHIFNREINNKKIFFVDGIFGIYFLMEMCNKLSSKTIFEIDINYFFERVINSEITKNIRSEVPNEIFGLNGYWGMNLFYKYLQNKLSQSF